MGKQQLDQFLIARVMGGEAQVLPRSGFGIFHFKHLLFANATSRHRLLEFPHLDGSHDELIRKAFEQIRNGLSPDRFLCDPKLSAQLRQRCAKMGLIAPEPAINLRLLAMRKRGDGLFKPTDRPARARDFIDRLGPGVEAAMLQTTIRYGASVDNMLAHPNIGKAFVKKASDISPGGTGIEYRLCALQIRKGRNTGAGYDERIKQLTPKLIESRWEDLGSLEQAARRDLPQQSGLIELLHDREPLYLMRPYRINYAVARSFRPEVIERLFRSDPFFEGSASEAHLRMLPRKRMPTGTPKSWELALVQAWAPRFNWPMLEEAA